MNFIEKYKSEVKVKGNNKDIKLIINKFKGQVKLPLLFSFHKRK